MRPVGRRSRDVLGSRLSRERWFTHTHFAWLAVCQASVLGVPQLTSKWAVTTRVPSWTTASRNAGATTSTGKWATETGNPTKTTLPPLCDLELEAFNVYVGHWHTCITSQTNEVYCWGDGEYGKLGDGSTAQNNFAGASAKVNHFSGTNPVKAHGDITSWAIHPSLPTGLSFGSSNGTIWGTPTASIPQTNFTIFANNSGGSSSLVLNLGVNPDSPGPFEYIPENNTLTNNSLVHIAPSFVNISTGSGTTWQVGTSDTGPGSNFAFNINGVVYFDAGSNEKLWAYNPTTNTTWKVNNTVTWVGEHMAYAVDDTIYFSGHKAATGREFYAYTTTNQTMWLVSDIRSGTQNSNPGQGDTAQDGHVLFFKANDGNGVKWYTYNHSNGTLTKLSKYFTSSGGGFTLTEAMATRSTFQQENPLPTIMRCGRFLL